jgi:hypothetical protein
MLVFFARGIQTPIIFINCDAKRAPKSKETLRARMKCKSISLEGHISICNMDCARIGMPRLGAYLWKEVKEVTSGFT